MLESQPWGPPGRQTDGTMRQVRVSNDLTLSIRKNFQEFYSVDNRVDSIDSGVDSACVTYAGGVDSADG